MKIEAEQRQKEMIANRALFLGKWLWIVFWLIVPAAIAGLIDNDYVIDISPSLYMIGQIISVVCSVAYGALLIKLSSEEDRYRIAGICAIIAAAAGVLLLVFSGAAKAPTWTLLFTLPASIVGLVGEYNEYNAHSIVLTGVDNKLSEEWTMLWKWYIGCMLGIIGGDMLGNTNSILIVPILGHIVSLVAAIGITVVSIAKFVYLYRTAKVFQYYLAEGD